MTTGYSPDEERLRASITELLLIAGSTLFTNHDLEKVLRLRRNLAWFWLGPPSSDFLGSTSIIGQIVNEWEESAEARSARLSSLSSLVRCARVFAALARVCLLALRNSCRDEGPRLQSNSLVLVDYLARVRKSTEFYSGYWTLLSASLRKTSLSVDYLHIFVPTLDIPDLKTARQLLASWNERIPNEKHLLVQDFVNFRISFMVIRDYLMVQYGVIRSWRALRKRLVTNPASKAFWISWKRSLMGSTLVHNLMFLSVFESLFGCASPPRACLFLQEGQAWEKCLLSTWKEHFESPIWGVQYSTVRYWDLRWLCHRKADYLVPEGLQCPQADLLLVSGAPWREQLLSNGYARGNLRDVEALYYLEIWREKIGTIELLPDGKTKILVLGEYDRVKTERLLSLVTAKLDPTSTNFEIMFRDHPAAPIPLKLPNEVMNLSRELTLNEAISRADVLISWAGTSAATVGYLQGKSLIMLRQYNLLNMSDFSSDKLAPGSGAVLLTSPKDLLSSVLAAARPHKTERDLWTQFFNLDEDLPKWLSLIEEVQGTAMRDVS